MGAAAEEAPGSDRVLGGEAGPGAGGGLPPGARGAGGAPAAGAQEHRRGHRLRQLNLLQAQLTAAQDAPQQGENNIQSINFLISSLSRELANRWSILLTGLRLHDSLLKGVITLVGADLAFCPYK